VCLQKRYLAQGAVAMLVSLIAATKDDGVVSEAFHACVAMLMGSDPEVRCCVHGVVTVAPKTELIGTPSLCV
jgi:hypothetical protein